MRGISDFNETACAVCGKAVCIADKEEWAYKVVSSPRSKMKYFCSWRCMRTMEHNRKPGSRAGKKQEIFALLADGRKDREIAEKVGVTVGAVRYWRDKYIGKAE